MTRAVPLYLVGCFVLVSLAGCGRGFFQTEEREPWRAEAEIACLKSGAVKESADLVRIDPISGPGVCGAEFPLKVAALGDLAAANITLFGHRHTPTRLWCGAEWPDFIDRPGRRTRGRRHRSAARGQAGVERAGHAWPVSRAVFGSAVLSATRPLPGPLFGASRCRHRRTA